MLGGYLLISQKVSSRDRDLNLDSLLFRIYWVDYQIILRYKNTSNCRNICVMKPVSANNVSYPTYYSLSPSFSLSLSNYLSVSFCLSQKTFSNESNSCAISLWPVRSGRADLKLTNREFLVKVMFFLAHYDRHARASHGIAISSQIS